KGRKRRNKARNLLATKHQQVRGQRPDVHQQVALMLLRSYDTLFLEDLRVANRVRNQHLAKEPLGCRLGGIPRHASGPGSRRREARGGGYTRRLPRRIVQRVESGWRSGSPCAHTAVLSAGSAPTALTMRRCTAYGPGRPVGERWDHPPCGSEHLWGFRPGA